MALATEAVLVVPVRQLLAAKVEGAGGRPFGDGSNFFWGHGLGLVVELDAIRVGGGSLCHRGNPHVGSKCSIPKKGIEPDYFFGQQVRGTSDSVPFANPLSRYEGTDCAYCVWH